MSHPIAGDFHIAAKNQGKSAPDSLHTNN